MSSAIQELNIETKSSEDFPTVAQYLNKEICPIFIREEDRSFFIKKIEMENNYYEVPRTMDIVSAIEITGKFENRNSITEIYSKIKWIDIEIGGEIITRIHLKNDICNISANNYFYTIHIPLEKILYNIGFIPVLNSSIRETILFKDFYKYDGVIYENQIKLVNESGRGLNSALCISILALIFTAG